MARLTLGTLTVSAFAVLALERVSIDTVFFGRHSGKFDGLAATIARCDSFICRRCVVVHRSPIGAPQAPLRFAGETQAATISTMFLTAIIRGLVNALAVALDAVGAVLEAVGRWLENPRVKWALFIGPISLAVLGYALRRF